MSTHETEQEQAARTPVRRAPGPSPAPAPGLVELASVVGNQAFSHAVAGRPAPVGRTLDRRSPLPRPASASLRRAPHRGARPSAALVARDPDEPEDPGLEETQKSRMRAMCVAPIRSAAGKLAAGEKANVRSVIRHLRPVVGALNAFSAQGPTRQTIRSAAEELSVNIILLDSLALSDKQAIFLARTSWQTARRQIAATRRQLKAAPDAEPEEASAIEEGRAHLDSLSQQVAATIRDLVEAPRTQEGFREVAETAAQLIDQFDSFASEGGEIPASFVAARKSVFDGLARIVPLALGKEEALNEAKASLARVANKLAALSDDEVEEEPEPEEEEEEEEEEEPGAPVEPAPGSLGAEEEEEEPAPVPAGSAAGP